MEDRQLNFTTNNDPTIVKLEKKKQSTILKSIEDLEFILSVTKSYLKSDTLQEGFKETLLSGMENHTTDILKNFEYESVLVKEKAERYQEIRSLNLENRDLRSQLGQKVSDEDVREAFKNLSSRLQNWGKSLGLYANKFVFNEYGAEIKIDPGISGIIFCDDDSRGIKSFLDMKAEREGKGYQFMEGHGREQAELIMNDNNINILKNEIRHQFPTCRFRDLKVSESSITGMCLDEITFFIYDLNQIPKNTTDK